MWIHLFITFQNYGYRFIVSLASKKILQEVLDVYGRQTRIRPWKISILKYFNTQRTIPLHPVYFRCKLLKILIFIV